MLAELKYRWALRKYLNEHDAVRKFYDETPEDPENPGDLPREKYVIGRELNSQAAAIDTFRSKYLVEQAYRYHVPLPTDEEDWEQSRFAEEQILTARAAQKLRSDIRAEQKGDWDFWAARVTLALALIGSIFGVLAFFKK